MDTNYEMVEAFPDVLQKRDEESQNAWQAMLDLYRMGPGHSIGDLQKKYIAMQNAGKQVPSVKYQTLANWSSRYDWKQRCDIAHQLQSQNEISALNEAKIEFTWKQVELLVKWEQMLLDAAPDYDDVGFSEWTKSVMEFMKSAANLFGAQAVVTPAGGIQNATQVNVNVGPDSSPSEANRRLQELLDAARARGGGENVGGNAEPIDVESRPVGRGGKGK